MIAILNIIYQASMPLDQSSGLQLTKFEITNVGHIDVSVSGKDQHLFIILKQMITGMHF